ncbi:golgi apparatus membrane protein Tvp15p [Monosporozyma unispora]
MSFPPALFKYANLVVGTLSALAGVAQLAQIFTDFNTFIQGLFAIVLSTYIIYLEFKIPTQLYKYASFYFSFLGRGALHILLASLLGHGVSFLRFFTILSLVFTGIGYFFCHVAKFVEEPDNFKINDNAIMVGDDQFDDDDDDEVV